MITEPVSGLNGFTVADIDGKPIGLGGIIWDAGRTNWTLYGVQANGRVTLAQDGHFRTMRADMLGLVVTKA